MKTFPVMLKLDGKRALVVGSGAIGLRKANALLDAGASVQLILGANQTPPAATPGLSAIEGDYDPAHLDGISLVFSCTDDPAINAQVARDARERNLWVCAVDQPDDCDFYSPAVLEQGDLIVAVGTGGAAPGLAGFVRDQLADAIPAQAADFAAALRTLRTKLQAALDDAPARMKIIKTLSGQVGHSLFVAGGAAALDEAAKSLQANPAAPLVTRPPSTPPDRVASLRPIAILAAALLSLGILLGQIHPPLYYVSHVIMAAFALLALAVSAGAGVWYLRTQRRLKRKDLALLSHRSVSLETLDTTCRRALLGGGICLTVAIALGFLNAADPGLSSWFSRYLASPKVMAGLIAWGVVALAVGIARARQFRGSAMAKLSILGFLLVAAVLATSFLVGRMG